MKSYLLGAFVAAMLSAACSSSAARQDATSTAGPATSTPTTEAAPAPSQQPGTQQPEPDGPSPTPADVQMFQVEPVLAPIASIEVTARTSLPAQYSLTVVSGLPNGCTVFDHYDVAQAGDVITVEVWNLAPKPDAGAFCTAVYRTETHAVPLDHLEGGHNYTIQVNDQTMTLTAE
jgi:hypothetical protein